ncbi:hypothetical protein MTR_7g087935 [Medicago truncatula]|uniref:Uncharacterized protein n=1 Tax=Medicago truncatula TaxID=3880 RepID=A0A072U2B5_MEDTR|nr:hypothetical protein MTR_7g087935 [Medicago truncatula]
MPPTAVNNRWKNRSPVLQLSYFAERSPSPNGPRPSQLKSNYRCPSPIGSQAHLAAYKSDSLLNLHHRIGFSAIQGANSSLEVTNSSANHRESVRRRRERRRRRLNLWMSESGDLAGEDEDSGGPLKVPADLHPLRPFLSETGKGR